MRPVWLSRNYGQHAATLAGCASTVGDWIVTMDEDGLHDPRSIDSMHRTAAERGVDLVYAHPRVHTHSRWRVVTSVLAKRIAGTVVGVKGAGDFSSFRLMDGFGTRALAAYCGYGVYLDVALQWVFDRATRVTTDYRAEQRPSDIGLLAARSAQPLPADVADRRTAAASIGIAVRPRDCSPRFPGRVGTDRRAVGRADRGARVDVGDGGDVGLLRHRPHRARRGRRVPHDGLAEVSGRPPYLITGRAPRGPTPP